MLRHRKSLSYLNESNSLDRVYDAAKKLIDALEDSLLSPSQIESRIERITEYVRRGERGYDDYSVYRATVALDGDKDVAEFAQDYAREVYNVIDEVSVALNVLFAHRD